MTPLLTPIWKATVERIFPEDSDRVEHIFPGDSYIVEHIFPENTLPVHRVIKAKYFYFYKIKKTKLRECSIHLYLNSIFLNFKAPGDALPMQNKTLSLNLK